jgi:hypothetical protein
MAKIVHDEAAPSEAVHYSFAGAEFDLEGAEASFETSDPAVISNAEAHPWLRVEREEAELVRGEYTGFLAPEDDALSAVNSVANDPEAVRAELDRRDADFQPLAVEAGLDQDEEVIEGGVSVTLAADDAVDQPSDDEGTEF